MERKPRPSLPELHRRVAEGPPYARELLELLQADLREGARALHATCLRRLAAAAAEDTRLDRMLCFEREAAECGFMRVAGVDEAGRGPLAGPLVAAAVVLGEPIAGLNDSKQLDADERESLYVAICGGRHSVSVAMVTSEEIDRFGIQTANYSAMVQAVTTLDPSPDFVLVDGFRIPGCPLPHRRIVKGDCRSLSIAAASIIAKVSRDRLMLDLDREYPGYGFARHKGYATEEHLTALERRGPCPIHRRSFAPLASRLETGSLFDLQEEGS